jgi:hypothetical protein
LGIKYPLPNPIIKSWTKLDIFFLKKETIVEKITKIQKNINKNYDLGWNQTDNKILKARSGLK